MFKQHIFHPAGSGFQPEEQPAALGRPRGSGHGFDRGPQRIVPGRNNRAIPSRPVPDSPAPACSEPAPVVDRSIEVPGFGSIQYRLVGSDSNPLTVALGGISADRRVDRWWSGVTGTGGALSGRRFRLLSMDWPVPTGEHPTTIDGFADALAGLLDTLGLAHVHSLVGASFGAMVGLAFGARHAGRLDRLIAISGAHRSAPAATAGRLIQREIIASLSRLGAPERGVALARGLALTSYRPAALFDQRFFDPDPDRAINSIQGYLEYNGGRFAGQFDAARYLALSTALDRHRVDPASVRCQTELIGVNSDALVPVSQLRELAGAIGMRARLHLLDSPYGHDAFLKSTELLNPLLARLLGEPLRENTHVRA